MGIKSKNGPESVLRMGESYKNWSQGSPQRSAKKKPSEHAHCLVEARVTQTQPSYLRMVFSLEVSSLN